MKRDFELSMDREPADRGVTRPLLGGFFLGET
jgi:hypothetical protein